MVSVETPDELNCIQLRTELLLRSTMSSFGEDLRMERVSRGIALEEIAATTKICARHLEALEQERFRLLPGGILNRGIVRGYAGVVGLDQQDWTERFHKAYVASGQMTEDDRDWMAFAANVGKNRERRRESVGTGLRWLGAICLALIAAAGVWLVARHF